MCFYSPLLYPECETLFESLIDRVSLVNSTASRSNIQSECLDSFFAEEVLKRPSSFSLIFKNRMTENLIIHLFIHQQGISSFDPQTLPCSDVVRNENFPFYLHQSLVLYADNKSMAEGEELLPGWYSCSIWWLTTVQDWYLRQSKRSFIADSILPIAMSTFF